MESYFSSRLVIWSLRALQVLRLSSMLLHTALTVGSHPPKSLLPGLQFCGAGMLQFELQKSFVSSSEQRDVDLNVAGGGTSQPSAMRSALLSLYAVTAG